MKITKQTILYLGITVAICVVLYLVLRRRNVEGMSSNASLTEFIAKGLGSDNTKFEDALLINKYKANYKTIIQELIKWCDLAVLNGLIASGKLNVKEGVSDTNTQIITGLNQYAELKKTLQDMYDNLLSN